MNKYDVKIAIHHRKGSFSERWIQYCKTNNINYKLVNAFDTNIIEQVADCDVFMWHHHHAHYEDVFLAKKILFALQHAGIKVFPNFETNWHFDDKVAQKYLLEAVGAPIVPSYVFFNKKHALLWAKNTTYPKVFKLKQGAGSSNVKLVKNRNEANKLIKQAFNKGFKSTDQLAIVKSSLKSKEKLSNTAKSLARLAIRSEFVKKQPREYGYVYFQDFIENDGFDIRVVVINNKAVALKRLVRKNDFRASGSGDLVFEDQFIDKRYIKMAFELNKKINSQSLAIDFIHGKNDQIYIVELSYGFPMLNFLDRSSGFWDESLVWHEDDFDLQGWMLEGLLN